MPTKPPSDRTRAKGVNPTHLTPGTVGAPSDHQNTQNEPNFHPGHDPIMQNEPNSRIPMVPPNHIYAKRTQSQPRWTCGGSKNAKRTQFTLANQPTPLAKGQSRRAGEPNFRRNPQYTFYNLQYTIPWPPLPAYHAERSEVPMHIREPNLPSRPQSTNRQPDWTYRLTVGIMP